MLVYYINRYVINWNTLFGTMTIVRCLKCIYYIKLLYCVCIECYTHNNFIFTLRGITSTIMGIYYTLCSKQLYCLCQNCTKLRSNMYMY